MLVVHLHFHMGVFNPPGLFCASYAAAFIQFF